MNTLSLLKLSAILSGFFLSGHGLAADLKFSPGFEPINGSEEAEFYNQFSEDILALEAIAKKTGNTVKSIEALEEIDREFPRISVALASDLISSENKAIASKAAEILASSIVMMNHHHMNATPEGIAMMKKVSIVKDALRPYILDSHDPLRWTAAGALASLGDEETLRKISAAAVENKIGTVEAINFLGLADPDLSSEYIAKYLNSDDVDAATSAVSYLAAVDVYQPTILRDIVQKKGVPNRVRLEGASALATYDQEYESYAPTLLVSLEGDDTAQEIYSKILIDYTDIATNKIEKSISAYHLDPDNIQTIKSVKDTRKIGAQIEAVSKGFKNGNLGIEDRSDRIKEIDKILKMQRSIFKKIF